MLLDEPPLLLTDADEDWVRTGDGVEFEAADADEEVCE